jgi:two-component system sensor histidine kinase ChvG
LKPDSNPQAAITAKSNLAAPPSYNPQPYNPQSENIDRLAHDARNVLSSLMLYCELLAAPGVLSQPHTHYAQELESIVHSAVWMIEKIVERLAAAQNAKIPNDPALPAPSAAPLRSTPVTDIADELRRLQPLLAAIAGPAIRFSIAAMHCAGRTCLAIEDLTRILVNLVRNAADAMPGGGHIRITAQYGDGLSFLDPARAAAFGTPRSVVLSIADDGPGIPEALRGRIFNLGFSTRKESTNWPAPRRRGLGLSIVRNLVEAARGTVSLAPAHMRGARFDITLPLNAGITSGTYALPPNCALTADSGTGGCVECQ